MWVLECYDMAEDKVRRLETRHQVRWYCANPLFDQIISLNSTDGIIYIA